jgi:hypothetical protein
MCRNKQIVEGGGLAGPAIVMIGFVSVLILASSIAKGNQK